MKTKSATIKKSFENISIQGRNRIFNLLQNNKIFYFTFILWSIAIISSAQPSSSSNSTRQGQKNGSGKNAADCQKRDQIRAEKIAFITQELSLTETEAQKFWPVYNEYNEKNRGVQKERHLLMRNFKEKSASMSTHELDQLGDSYIALDKKEIAIREEFYIRFKTVLPIQKLMKLYQAEHDFKINLIRKMND